MAAAAGARATATRSAWAVTALVTALVAVIVAAGHVSAVGAAPQNAVALFSDYEERNFCRVNMDCEILKACQHGRCRDPCPGACGQGASCGTLNHTPICYCPKGTLGDPFDRCYPQIRGSICTLDSDCDQHTSICMNGRCENRCRTIPPVCGMNTVCTANPNSVDCRCLEGFVGNPFKACFAKDGFLDGSGCRDDSDCDLQEACQGGKCGDPCVDACGMNAQCKVRSHFPVCSCADGFVGDPFTSCSRIKDTPPSTTTNRPGSPPPSPTPPSTTSPSPWAAPAGAEGAWLPALHRACLRCLCEAATGCEPDIACEGGYCGPFGVSRLYWHEAGRPVLPHDDPDRKEAYEDCANIYSCASRIVTEYILKLAKDCNGDGRVNCDDFAMAHHNGGYTCEQPLNRTAEGVKYQERYLKCRGEDEDDDPLGLAVASS